MPYYEQALRARPGLTEALNNLGGVLQRLGRRDEAIVRFREAVRLSQRVLLMSSRPGRFIREWNIGGHEPWRLDSPDVANRASEITDELRAELEAVVAAGLIETDVYLSLAEARRITVAVDRAVRRVCPVCGEGVRWVRAREHL